MPTPPRLDTLRPPMYYGTMEAKGNAVASGRNAGELKGNAVQIQTVRHTHEAILQYMLANPTAPQGLVAAHFGYTQSWISIIVNSDAFQAKLRERQDEMFSEGVVATLKDKIIGTAHLAVEKLAEKLETEKDARVIKDSAEMLLKSLGYGNPKPSAPHVQQNNVFVLADKESLANSRRLLAEINSERVDTAEPIDTLPEPIPSSVAG
jgi:hypothetical protein